MIREEKSNDTFGCGFNKRKYAGDAKRCKELGLDFNIHCMGPERIKRYLKEKYDFVIDIEGKAVLTSPEKPKPSSTAEKEATISIIQPLGRMTR